MAPNQPCADRPSRTHHYLLPARSLGKRACSSGNPGTPGVCGGKSFACHRAWSGGDEAALAALLPLVEAELRRLARAYMARERVGHTLQPTALINEAFLRLIDARQVAWQDRAHFLGISARLMRRVLVDHARTRDAKKRGDGDYKVALDENIAAPDAPEVDLS